MHLTLRSYSTALFATWHFIEELRLLFDAGDGVSAGLLSKNGKVRDVFLSHADRDHLTGLLQLLQLNPLGDRLTVHYPADCGSFPALAEFCRRFDPGVPPPIWSPIRHGDEVPLAGKRIVRAVRNPHVPNAEDRTKSLSYFVLERRRLLKPELAGMDQDELREHILEHGREAATDEHERRLIGYSADTPVLPASFWAGCEVLIHEATFLDAAHMEKRGVNDTNHHSVLGDVLAMVAEARPGRLVLTHFSNRYDAAQIRAAVTAGVAEHGISCPVDLVLPGTIATIELEV